MCVKASHQSLHGSGRGKKDSKIPMGLCARVSVDIQLSVHVLLVSKSVWFFFFF